MPSVLGGQIGDIASLMAALSDPGTRLALDWQALSRK
jgi:hypothetical protein